MNAENLEKLGQLKDEIDNLTAALSLPMPDNFHIKQLKFALPELAGKIKNIYINEGGTDEWQ